MREYHTRRMAAMTEEQRGEYSKKRNEASQNWHDKNLERAREIARQTRAKNRDRRLQDTREWRAKNKEKVIAYNKQWAELNKTKGPDKKTYPRTDEQKEKRNEMLKELYRTDPRYRAEVAVKTRIGTVLRRRKLSDKKSDSSIALLGCSVDFLMDYLKAMFKPGMSWNNHGEWHIDHIRPCASFDLTDPEQQRACFHYINLQPLWGIDNQSKWSSWNGKSIRRKK